MKHYKLNDVKVFIKKIQNIYENEYKIKNNINYIRCILNNIDIITLKEYVKLLKLCNCCKEHKKKLPKINKYPDRFISSKSNKIKLNINDKCDCFCRHEMRQFVRAIILDDINRIEDVFYIFNIILRNYNNIYNNINKNIVIDNNYINIIKQNIDRDMGMKYLNFLLKCNCCYRHKKLDIDDDNYEQKNIKYIKCVCPCRHYIRLLNKTFNI